MDRHLTAGEKAALGRFKDVLQALLGENLVSLRLFGSRARGEGTLESDLDVLVLLQHKQRTVCRRIVEAALEIDLAYDINLAPTILSVAEYEENRDYATPFYRNVEREGVPL